MADNKLNIIITILLVLKGIITGILGVFQNRKAQEEKKKVEESAEIQSKQSKEKANQILQTNLDTINSSLRMIWKN